MNASNLVQKMFLVDLYSFIFCVFVDAHTYAHRVSSMRWKSSWKVNQLFWENLCCLYLFLFLAILHSTPTAISTNSSAATVATTTKATIATSTSTTAATTNNAAVTTTTMTTTMKVNFIYHSVFFFFFFFKITIIKYFEAFDFDNSIDSIIECNSINDHDIDIDNIIYSEYRFEIDVSRACRCDQTRRNNFTLFVFSNRNWNEIHTLG